MPDLTAGWAWPPAARKAHYYLAGEAISVCGTWMYTGAREDSATGPDDCAKCKRIVKVRHAKG